MSIRSGLGASIGFAAESSWGTYTAPTRFLEFQSEGLELQQDPIYSTAIRRNNRVQRADRFVTNRKGASGPVSFEVADRGFGLIFKHMLGAGTVTTPGGGTATRTHTYTMGDHDGLSMTVQVVRPDIRGTANPFSYLGCKITDWELSNSVDGLLALSASFDGKDVTTAEAAAAVSYPSTQLPLSFVGGTVSVAGTAFSAMDFSIQGSNGLKTDRYFLQSSSLKKEQLPTSLASFTGSITSEFEDLTAYNRFANGGTAAVTALWEGTTIEGSFKYSVQVTLPCVLFTGDTPTVSGTDILQMSMPFTVLNDGSNEPISVVYTTTDVAS